MLCNQVEDTKDSIAKFSQRDTNNFGKVIRVWRRLVDDVIAPGTYLPPVAPMDMIEAFERTGAGRDVLRLTEDVTDRDHQRTRRGRQGAHAPAVCRVHVGTQPA